MSEQKEHAVISIVDNPLVELLSKPYVGSVLKKKIIESNLVLTPEENSSYVEGPYFRDGAGELFKFLQEANVEGLRPELAIEDKDYQELALYANWIDIGSFISTSVIVPIAVEVVAGYLKERIGLNYRKTDVRAEITVVRDEFSDGSSRKAIRVTYSGPASQFESTVLATIKKEVSENPFEFDGEREGKG